MHALVALALLVATAHAGIYTTSPVQSTTCTGGQACQVQWVDDGTSPLLSTIGDCDLSLYTGELQFVQDFGTIDVSTTSSTTVTPTASLGPNGAYYLVYTCSAANYTSYSASFTLVGMTATTPSGGSSASVPTTTTSSTSAGSSNSAAGSSVPATSTNTGSSSGTSTPTVGSTTPTGSTSAVDTTASTSPTSTVSGASTISGSSTTGIPTTTNPSTTGSSTASATATGAAARLTSFSFGGFAALFALTGAFVF